MAFTRWTLAAVVTAIWSSFLLFNAIPSEARELRAGFVEKCPTTDFPQPDAQREALQGLMVGIAGSLLDRLVDIGIASLKKVVNPDAVTLEGRFLVEGLYKYRAAVPGETAPKVVLNPGMECLVIIFGEFGGFKEWTPRFVDIPNERENAARTLFDQFGVNASPSIYIEAVRVYSESRTAVTWQPVRIFVAEFLNDSFFAGKARGLALDFSLSKPGQKDAFATETIVSIDPFALGPDGTYNLGPNDLLEKKRRAGQWIALPAASASELEGLKVGTVFEPVNLYVRIVETPKPYKLAIAFAEAVGDNAALIKTELKQAALPTVAAAAALTAAGAAITDLAAYLDALKTSTDACTTANVKPGGVESPVAALTCRIAISKASLARDKALASCKVAGGSDKVGGCANVPEMTKFP